MVLLWIRVLLERNQKTSHLFHYIPGWTAGYHGFHPVFLVNALLVGGFNHFEKYESQLG